jgi:hypothetical protein
MLNRRASLVAVSTLCAGLGGLLVSAAAPADVTAVAGAAQPGNWLQHKYTFNFFGFTTTYSCEGLEDKLRVLLKMSGAGPDVRDVHVDAPCDRGFGVPDKLAFAYLTFSTLQPAADSNAAPGEWRHVALEPKHPYQFDYGDCELIEQFRDKVLPMFATRNLNNNITCIPHQDSGSNYHLSFDVFGPPLAKKP